MLGLKFCKVLKTVTRFGLLTTLVAAVSTQAATTTSAPHPVTPVPIVPKINLQVSVLKPKITRVIPTNCVNPGARLIVYGTSFGSSKTRRIAAGGNGVHIDLKASSWSNTQIIAQLPASPKWKTGYRYYVGIEQSDHRRWLSNINVGFTLCGKVKVITTTIQRNPVQPVTPGKTPTPGTPGTPTAPSPENTTDNTESTDQTKSKTPSSPGSGLQSAIPSSPVVSINDTSANQKSRYVKAEIMVMSPNLKSAEALRKKLQANGYQIKRRLIYKNLGGIAVSVFRVPDGTAVADALTTLRGQFPKTRMDANHVYQLHGKSSNKTQGQIKWGPVTSSCGKGLKIGLLDTEIDTSHPAFKNRHVISKSFLTAGVKHASKSHATAIASLWVGNPQAGFDGVVPQARIYAAGVFEKIARKKVQTTTERLFKGLNWLVGKKVDVINMSLGGPRNQLLEVALANLLKKRVILIASAGNGGPKSAPSYPAAQKGVIAVTAVDQQGKIFKYATHGDYIDLSAPGVYLKVAFAHNRARYASGTSFAAPFVSAGAGILKKRHMNRAKIMRYFKTHSKDLGKRGKDPIYGFGLLQMGHACQ